MRRTHAEIRLGEQLRIGDRWARADGGVWGTIKQIHRRDAIAELDAHGRRELVRFEQLLRDGHAVEDHATGQLMLTAARGGRRHAQ